MPKKNGFKDWTFHYWNHHPQVEDCRGNRLRLTVVARTMREACRKFRQRTAQELPPRIWSVVQEGRSHVDRMAEQQWVARQLMGQFETDELGGARINYVISAEDLWRWRGLWEV